MPRKFQQSDFNLLLNVELNRLHQVISKQQKCLSFSVPHWAPEASLTSWAGVLPNFGTFLRKRRITAGWTNKNIVYTSPFSLLSSFINIITEGLHKKLELVEGGQK